MRLVRPIAVALIALPLSLSAQRTDRDTDAEWLEHCRDRGSWGSDDRGRACEVRNVPVQLSGRSLAVDGVRNGSVRVYGWDRNSTQVTARMQAEGRSDAEARERLTRIRFVTDGRSVRADGPDMDGDYRGWSVSYVVFVPRRFDLDLEAHNGSLGVYDVAGRMDLRTHNGSVALSAVGGDVRAHTQNGSLNVQLAGSRWDGTGLEADTRNGSVRLAVPDPYAANLEIGTVNGAIRTDIPITVSGRISRELRVPLGGGGQPLRVRTTNGSVTIARR